MITVENLIVKLSYTIYNSKVSINNYDQKIIFSFSEQIARNVGFTEKQATLALKILKKYKNHLNTELKLYVGDFFENPLFKFPIRTSINQKIMSIVQTGIFNKEVKVQFPYNETYITKIRQNKNKLDKAIWNPDEKSWFFSLSEKNLRFLMDFANTENFQISNELKMYFDQIVEVIKNIENIVPMLTLDGTTIKFKNISEKIPDFSTNNILEAFFTARKYGIFSHDDVLAGLLDQCDAIPVIKEFLKTDPSENFYINSEKTDFSQLTDIIKYLSPCLFVIPNGNQLEDLQKSVNFLNSIGISNEQMSVMFRLPSETDKNFNIFVKNQNLNNLINENIQVAFINGKLPKPLLKSQIKFNSIVNLGGKNDHRVIKNFIENHENLIIYTNQSLQKEFRFAPL